MVCRFKNDMPTQHAQWVEVETPSLTGSGQPVIRRMLRNNAIEAWETMQKSGGWKRVEAVSTQVVTLSKPNTPASCTEPLIA